MFLKKRNEKKEESIFKIMREYPKSILKGGSRRRNKMTPLILPKKIFIKLGKSGGSKSRAREETLCLKIWFVIIFVYGCDAPAVKRVTEIAIII